MTTKEIIVITGMRQVGKTTLLNYIFNKIKSRNKAMFDLENPLHRKVFEEENYDNILHSLKKYNITDKEKVFLFIDEIQNLPEITKVIKYLYDHYEIKFFLTGSSSFYLKNLFPESLAGRKLIFELFPLTFREFLTFKGVKKEFVEPFQQKSENKSHISDELYKKYYSEYINFGGLPRVVIELNYERKTKLLEEIFTSFFEKDVKNLADFKELAKLRDLILLLAARVGSQLDVTKLSSELSLSRETIYSYLYFLDQVYFISLISKFSRSPDRKIATGKKLYFCDSGIASILLGGLSQGQLFENSIFQNLRVNHRLSYYSSASGKEIDFIIDNKICLEAKATASKRDIELLKRTAGSISLNEYYVTSMTYTDLPNVIPAYEL